MTHRFKFVGVSLGKNLQPLLVHVQSWIFLIKVAAINENPSLAVGLAVVGWKMGPIMVVEGLPTGKVFVALVALVLLLIVRPEVGIHSPHILLDTHQPRRVVSTAQVTKMLTKSFLKV